MSTTDSDDQGNQPAWRAAGILLLPLAIIAAAFFIDPIFGDDIEADHLTSAADFVREQMDGAQTEQVSRAVLPPYRNASLLAWVDYDADDWAMCLFTSDSPTAEGSNHLLFGASGDYVIQSGSCPDTRTLDIPLAD